MSNHGHNGMKTMEGLNPFCSTKSYGEESYGDQRDDRFGRLFPELSPAYKRPDILAAIGAVGGPMDGKSANDRTDTVPVGMVFFGQFVDHDVTLDASTTFDSVVDNPGEIANVRTPTFDLDGIYGLGPEAQPYPFCARRCVWRRQTAHRCGQPRPAQDQRSRSAARTQWPRDHRRHRRHHRGQDSVCKIHWELAALLGFPYSLFAPRT